MNPAFPFRRAVALLISCFLAASRFARADEEVCSNCDKQAMVVGEFRHGNRDNAVIQGALGRESAYREEIHGARFSVSVPGLSAGRYTIEIGVTEVYYDGPGLRLFDIVCGDQPIATNLDIFAAAGGAGIVHRI